MSPIVHYDGIRFSKGLYAGLQKQTNSDSLVMCCTLA